MRLFVGDDCAEDHHDVEVMAGSGKVLAKKRLPEGVAGMAGLHELIGAHLPEGADGVQVLVGIETDRGPWVQALVNCVRTSKPPILPNRSSESVDRVLKRHRLLPCATAVSAPLQRHFSHGCHSRYVTRTAWRGGDRSVRRRIQGN